MFSFPSWRICQPETPNCEWSFLVEVEQALGKRSKTCQESRVTVSRKSAQGAADSLCAAHLANWSFAWVASVTWACGGGPRGSGERIWKDWGCGWMMNRRHQNGHHLSIERRRHLPEISIKLLRIQRFIASTRRILRTSVSWSRSLGKVSTVAWPWWVVGVKICFWDNSESIFHLFLGSKHFTARFKFMNSFQIGRRDHFGMILKKLVTTYHGCLWWGFSPRFRLDLKELEPFTGVIGTIKGRMKEADFLGWNLSWTSPSSWFVDVGTASMLVSVLLTFQCEFDTVSPFLVVVFIFHIWCVWNSYSCWRAWTTLFWGLALFNQQPLACQVIPMLATAMRNLQQTEGYSEAAIVQWLDTFFLSRIGTATRIPPAEAFSFWRRCLPATGILIALRLRYQWMIQRFVNLCHERMLIYFQNRIQFWSVAMFRSLEG